MELQKEKRFSTFSADLEDNTETKENADSDPENTEELVVTTQISNLSNKSPMARKKRSQLSPLDRYHCMSPQVGKYRDQARIIIPRSESRQSGVEKMRKKFKSIQMR